MGGSVKGIPERQGEEISGQNERTMTSKKFEVRRLKRFSREGRVSELHARLAARLRIATSQEVGKEKRVEKVCPHGAKSVKSRKWSLAPAIAQVLRRTL
jgi:hypothetical protein